MELKKLFEEFNQLAKDLDRDKLNKLGKPIENIYKRFSEAARHQFTIIGNVTKLN